MRLKLISGKIVQLSHLPVRSWSRFLEGWWRREQSGTVPCVLPHSRRLLNVPVRDFYDSYWFFSESKRGRDELGFFLNHLRPGDVVYDVGAFRGVYGAAAKTALGDSVDVHLFEPLPQNFRSIEEISKQNEFQRFQIIATAVGKDGTAKGVLDTKDGMLREGDTSDKLVPTEMPSISLDSYVEKTGIPPTIIKLDVDGFECQVLEGARQCLADHKPRLWLELHPDYLKAQGRSWEDPLSILKSAGYQTFDFYTDYHLPARNTPFHVWCEP